MQVTEKINDNADEIEGYVSKIISASSDDFLDFTVRDGEFYLAQVINYLKTFYSDKLKDAGTELVFGDYDDLLLAGDGERFTEVLQNIFENAIKYGDGRRISVDFGDEEDCKLITVSNTGCTLPADEAGRIFDSFYRGSNVGNRSGSGLGLYICKKLMTLMHGEIFAEIEDDVMKVTVVCPRG